VIAADATVTDVEGSWDLMGMKGQREEDKQGEEEKKDTKEGGGEGRHGIEER
jgi:hypothetical protein